MPKLKPHVKDFALGVLMNQELKNLYDIHKSKAEWERRTQLDKHALELENDIIRDKNDLRRLYRIQDGLESAD